MVASSLSKIAPLEQPVRTRVVKLLFRVLLIATFAVWFGGFFFYAAFVVPLGNEVLGSARAQGFITRLVVHRINAMCLGTIVLMIIELISSWRWSPRWNQLVQTIAIILIGVLLAILVAIHPQLDKLLDVPRRQVTERAAFYQLHRIYLWAITVQWGLAWVWLFAVLTNWNEKFRLRSCANLS